MQDDRFVRTIPTAGTNASFANRVLVAFDVLPTTVTPLQQAVWRALCTIPYGTTLSYAQLAERAGHPGACRAAGTANGKNPLPILIPCHRVIHTDGSLGGYSSGLEIKRILLKLENDYA